MLFYVRLHPAWCQKKSAWNCNNALFVLFLCRHEPHVSMRESFQIHSAPASDSSSCLSTARAQKHLFILALLRFWERFAVGAYCLFFLFLFLFCAHCVYTANYAWRLCTPSSCCLSHPSVFLADWLIVLRWICWIQCASGKRAFGSRLHQSHPSPTATPSRTSPLINRLAAHYWRHFTLAWHVNECWQSVFELLAPGKG